VSETEIPTYDEALAMLAVKATEGSVTAIVALERALRTRPPVHEPDELDELIEEMMTREPNERPQ